MPMGKAIRPRENCMLVYIDDKHWLIGGEPGVPVAAAKRGWKVMV